MQIGRLLGQGRVAEVFEAGADVIKLYRAGVGPEQARHEAGILDALRHLDLTVPRSLGVMRVDGRWGLLMTRMPGQPLAERMLAAVDPSADLLLLADLHHQIHQHHAAALAPLKARLANRLERVRQLSEVERAVLLERLAALPDGDRLCHGDFHPLNIMIDGERAGIIDWLDATRGPPEADVARTYLLALHNLPALAEPYLATRLRGAAFGRREIEVWLPVLAAARLAENVPEEEARLLALARGA